MAAVRFLWGHPLARTHVLLCARSPSTYVLAWFAQLCFPSSSLSPPGGPPVPHAPAAAGALPPRHAFANLCCLLVPLSRTHLLLPGCQASHILVVLDSPFYVPKLPTVHLLTPPPQVVPLSRTHLLLPERYPRFTLARQAAGSVVVGLEALRQLVPEVGRCGPGCTCGLERVGWLQHWGNGSCCTAGSEDAGGQAAGSVAVGWRRCGSWCQRWVRGFGCFRCTCGSWRLGIRDSTLP